MTGNIRTEVLEACVESSNYDELYRRCMDAVDGSAYDVHRLKITICFIAETCRQAILGDKADVLLADMLIAFGSIMRACEDAIAETNQ